MGRAALGCRHQSSPAQTTARQKSCFLLSFLPALWFLAVQCCSFYTDLQARERWGYSPEMWECGLKSPQAEEASNPSLNGGPSAVARSAADHRGFLVLLIQVLCLLLKAFGCCFIPFQQLYSLRGEPQSQPHPCPCQGALAGQCCFSPWAALLLDLCS